MTITVGRVGLVTTLTSPRVWNEDGDGTISVSGRYRNTTLATALVLRRQLIGLRNPDEPVVPVTWTADPTIDGYYHVAKVEVDGIGAFLATGLLSYAIDLQRVQPSTAHQWEASSGPGTVAVNAHSIAAATSIPWHALPAGHSRFDVAAAISTTNRTASDGVVNVHHGGSNVLYGAGGIPARAIYNLPPADVYDQAARIADGEPITYTQYLNLPGVGTAYASTPDAAALDIVGDIDIRAKVVMDDWTPAATAALVSKYGGGGGTYSYSLRVLLTSGVLRFSMSTNGNIGGILNFDSTVAPTVANGATLWVRVIFDVNDGAGNKVATFYTGTTDTNDHSAVTWTQLGAPVVSVGTTALVNGTAQLRVGVDSDGAGTFAGKVYAAAVLNGIAGTAAADPVFGSPNQFAPGVTTGTDATGKVWTIAGTAAIVAPSTFDQLTANHLDVVGRHLPDDPDGWLLDNKLTRVGLHPITGFWVGAYDGTNWDYKAYQLVIGSTTVAPSNVKSAQVLKNTAEEVRLRLFVEWSSGAATVDLSLRRGSRYVAGTVKLRRATDIFTVRPIVGEAGTDLIGGLRATANDVQGNRLVLASMLADNNTVASSQLVYNTASGTRTSWAFMIGVEVGGSAATGIDAAQDLIYQYMAAQGEVTERVVA